MSYPVSYGYNLRTKCHFQLPTYRANYLSETIEIYLNVDIRRFKEEIKSDFCEGEVIACFRQSLNSI